MSSPAPSLDDLRIQRRDEVSFRTGNRALRIVGASLLLILAAAVWWLWGSTSAIPVRVAKAVEAAPSSSAENANNSSGSPAPTQRTILNASGYVTARRAATVSSKVTGKVMEVFIEEGMKVHDGQILARLDDSNVKASLALADAQLRSTSASLEESRVRLQDAERELGRQSDLKSKRIASQSDYDRANTAMLALRAKLLQQRADIEVQARTVDSWKQQLEDTIIRAPFAGIVTSKNAQPGEMISPMSAGGSFTRTGICTIVDMDSLEIEVDVNESYINRVQVKQPVLATLDAYPDWKIPCHVVAVIPTADRQKSTVKVRVGFDKLDPKILPEMGVKVGFQEPLATPDRTIANNSATSAGKSAAPKSPSAAGVLVPKAAVTEDSGRDIVYVVKNSRAERRAVSIVERQPDTIWLNAGVSPGDDVILDRPEGLTDGAAVKIVNSK